MNKIDTSAIRAGAPWHRESYDKLLGETLPQLLARRLPLTDYKVTSVDEFTSRVEVCIGGVSVAYTIASPNEEGLFQVEEAHFVVVPLASDENLDTAEIKCVGEQLYDHIESRLGEANGDLPWDEALVRAWLPLESWVHAVVTSAVPYDYERNRWATGQWIDQTNMLAAVTHLRRIFIPSTENVVAPGQFGRVCPFETPEGPNIGHVFSIAIGATIRGGRIEIIDDRPEAALGLSASMIPFLEHNDVNRALFGTNMQRQGPAPSDPELAIVQTGNEPDLPGIWTGRNLLTAFVSMGAETYEDSILVSESAAKRLSYPSEALVGDRINNRHGQKGVISRILPDDQMPRLADGTPTDLVCSFIGLHTRKNFGQVREAVMSRIARAEGEPVIVPPFHAPSEAEIRERLLKAGLPKDGIEVLYDPRLGRDLDRPSVVGWVYWSRSIFTSAGRVFASVIGPPWQAQGELEHYNLRDLGCYETLAEMSNTRSVTRPDAAEFVERVKSGPVEHALPPTPAFANLVRRLNAAGVLAELGDSELSLRIGRPSGDAIDLAQPVPHPWLKDHTLSAVGMLDDVPECAEVANANTKLQRAIDGGAPESLRQKALVDLEQRVNDYFGALITRGCFWFFNRVMFSGRCVLAPGLDLRLDQVGIADEMAWTIFGPLLVRELGDEAEVSNRTEKAANALDELMARSWVIVNRAPTILPTNLMAFHPVRIPDPVIRLHPLVCFLMNGDFDGDQAAVFLPITEAAQREAVEKLSLAGHLRRDPNLFGLRFITQEALWGLAQLSLQPGGVDEINELSGLSLGETVDRDTVAAALCDLMRTDGVEAVLQAMQNLMDRGFQAARESGASISPFIGSTFALPDMPEGDDPGDWDEYMEEVTDLIQSRIDYSSSDIGPQLLAVKSGARGTIAQMPRLVSASGLVTDAAGQSVPIRHNMRDGLTSDEIFACIAGARKGLAKLASDMDTAWAYGFRAEHAPKGFGVLVRAMRASHPGPVLARAAAAGECDPLTDLDARLFVGLKPV